MLGENLSLLKGDPEEDQMYPQKLKICKLLCSKKLILMSGADGIWWKFDKPEKLWSCSIMEDEHEIEPLISSEPDIR